MKLCLAQTSEKWEHKYKMVILAWGKGPNHFFDYELMNFGENNIGK